MGGRFFVFVCFLIVCSCVKSYAVTDTLTPPTDDSYVALRYPDSNSGSLWCIVVDENFGGSNIHARIFLKFDASSIPSDATVTLAKLRLCCQGLHSWPNRPVLAYGVEFTEWFEDSITWNNQPPYDTTLQQGVKITSTGWKEWDVTSWVNGRTGGNISFCLKSYEETAGYGQVAFWSKEHDGDDPQLVVTYELEDVDEVSNIATEPLFNVSPIPSYGVVHIDYVVLANSIKPVFISVYNLAGKFVTNLVPQYKPNGIYSTCWVPAESGVYIIVLIAGDKIISKKAIIMR